MYSCKEYSEIIKRNIYKHVSILPNHPKLVVIQIGDDPASCSYVKGKEKDCKDVGILFDHIKLQEDVAEDDLRDLILSLNNKDDVNGIILQLPVPKHIDIKFIQSIIDEDKDVDGFNVNSNFDPCTPKGVIDYLKYHNYKFEGKTACVVGRSDIVGKPLAQMLIDQDCTVTVCHSKTEEDDLRENMYWSDIVFTCTNQIGYYDETYFDKESDIIDIGLGIGEDGKLCGNITKKAATVLKEDGDRICISGIGGVGLLTRLALLVNTLKAYYLQNGKTIPNWMQ